MNSASASASLRITPYVGLMPFSEQDAVFFFGRTSDIEIVATNLRAARMTVFYGSSGVGKSSLLNAGVIPYLRRVASASMLSNEPPEFILVTLRDWANDPIDGLKLRIADAVVDAVNRHAIPRAGGDSGGGPLTMKDVDITTKKNAQVRDLSNVLKNWTDLTGSSLLIILDQFEDFFLHPKYTAGEGSFGEEFSKAANNKELPVNFMISMRDDALAKLDLFRGKIPDLTRNTLRLFHLDRRSAEEAIRKPIEKFNELMTTTFAIEDELVAKLLEDVQVDKVKFETQGQANADQSTIASSDAPKPDHAYKVETPYLQLVMVQLWQNDITQATKRLSLDTLTDANKLGGVQEIVRTHLDKVIDEFPDADKDLLAEFIHFTVTRTGAKIPSSAAGLAEWAEMPDRKEDIEKILVKLSTGEHRILRTVDNIKDPNNKYYEISHDALAPAVLSWRTRYLERAHLSKLDQVSSRLDTIRKWAIRIVPSLALILVGIFVAGFYFAYTSGESTGNKLATNANAAAANANQAAAEANRVVAEEMDILAAAEKKKAESVVELLSIFGTLSRGSVSEKEAAIQNLRRLNDNGNLPDDVKAAFSELASRVMDPESASQIREILKKQQELQDPRAFLHFLDPRQKDAEPYIKQIFGGVNLKIAKSETFDNIRLVNTQVRYFHDTDRDRATQVAELLQKAGLPRVRAKFIPGYENRDIPMQQLEVWFAPDAMSVRAKVATSEGSFLWLRRTPEVKKDNLIVEMPTGQTVERQICPSETITIDSRTGRWCRVSYNNQTGWAFDGWLEYQDQPKH